MITHGFFTGLLGGLFGSPAVLPVPAAVSPPFLGGGAARQGSNLAAGGGGGHGQGGHASCILE